MLVINSKKDTDMSSNSLASLNDLPVELVHYIINYLDTQTVFVLLYEVCKRLKSIVESHHQYELDFCLISKTDFFILARIGLMFSGDFSSKPHFSPAIIVNITLSYFFTKIYILTFVEQFYYILVKKTMILIS